jgi:diguanylate cyclase (GGDEF)-like protein
MANATRVKLAVALRVGEFRALWAAETISVAGDQLARVALALLVYGRTSSALLTGLTYALTFLPAFLGGLFLAGLADRFPRRTIILATDALRACLAAAMAIPGLPLVVLWALVAVLTFAYAPYKAAQQALIPQILQDKDQYVAGTSLRQISNQVGQFVAFAAGGVLVTAISAQGALLLDAATFVVSIVLVSRWVRPRPASARSRGNAGGEDDQVEAPTRPLVPVFILCALIGLWVVPEGIAAPYAEGLGAGSAAVGWLMAADPVGSALGGWLATKINRVPALNSLFWPAALAGVPLVMCVVQPGLWVSVVLWALSGAASTILLVRQSAYVVSVVPDARLARTMGRLSACLQTSTGLAVLGGGALAGPAGPFVAVATAGGLSVVLVVVVALMWGGARRREGGEQQDDPGQMSLLRTLTSWKRRPAPGGDGAGPGHGSPVSMASSQAVTQPPERGQGGASSLWVRPPAAVAYISTVSVIAAVVVAWSFLVQVVTRTDLLMLVLILGLGIVAAEVSRRVERMRRMITDAPHVNLSSVWTVAAALVLPAGLSSVAVVVLYAHLWFRSWRRLPGFRFYRVVFNVSNVILCCQMTAWLAHRVGLHPADLMRPWWTLWLFAVVIAAYFALNSAIAAVAIAFLQSDRSWGRLLGAPSENLLELATLCMGALAAVLLSVSYPLILLVYLPLYALHRSVLLRQFEHDAISDSKTGLLNAASWHSLAVKELERARNNGTTAGLMLVKINGVFRDDDVSQATRDRALRAVADTLTSQTRNYDLCGRLGGEEFVVLLPGVAGEQAVSVADRIRHDVGERLAGLSVTLGVSEYPATSTQLEELLIASSNALYAAGPNQVRVVEKF